VGRDAVAATSKDIDTGLRLARQPEPRAALDFCLRRDKSQVEALEILLGQVFER
jgi:hypothetical protein